MAVVDSDGSLLTSISNSDLRITVSGEVIQEWKLIFHYIFSLVLWSSSLLTPQRFRFAGTTVLEFVQHSRELDGSQERPAVVKVSPSTPLIDVFGKLVKTGLHRVYVADAEHKPVGVVSLKDLLRFVLKHSA